MGGEPLGSHCPWRKGSGEGVGAIHSTSVRKEISIFRRCGDQDRERKSGGFLYIAAVQSLNHVPLFAALWTAATGILRPSPSPGACSSSCPSSRWCHPLISSSVVPFFSCLWSFPASGSFPVSQFFTSDGQSIRASALVLPMSIQNWFPLGWTGWISLQSKGLSRVLSSTTVQKTSILQCSAFFMV